MLIKQRYLLRNSMFQHKLKCNEDKEKNPKKIPFAVFLFTEFESKTACDYIIENSQKVLHYLVDENKIEVMSKIIPILNQKQ